MDKLEYEGMPKSEEERRKVWLSFPREARAAVRRLHHAMGHVPRSVLGHILRGAKADRSVIEACKHFRCPTCAEVEKEGTPPPVKPPSRYSVNHEVILDVMYQKDDNNQIYQFLNIIHICHNM